MAATTEFELVSPERLLMQRAVEMVIVPGTEGNFAALPRHAPFLSTLRPGVIEVYDKRPDVAARLFVDGGFAEVTAERCTVLAAGVLPVSEIERGPVEQEIRDLTEDLADADSAAERDKVARALAVARAKLVAIGR